MLPAIALLATLSLLSPAAHSPEEVAAWLARTATPLASLDSGGDAAGFAALKTIVGDARIVALGEATHGSHEFFAFKARAVEYLVRELGFTDFAMETDAVAALAANEWLEHGRGDLDTALKSISGLWRTAEYRELFVWLRAWNADPAHAQKVRFHGLDMAASGPTAKRLRAYLATVDPEVEEGVGPVIERLANGATLDPADLDGLLALFEELHEPFVERSSEREWALQRQHVVLLIQSYRQRALQGNEQTSWRDRCMADNARWILRQGGAGARLVFSAHNGHVSRAGLTQVEGYGAIESIGRALSADAKTVKDENLAMVVIGAALGRGGFYAYGASGGGLQAFTLGAPRAEAQEVPFLAAGLKLALVDLRAAPAGPVHDWFASSRPLRFVGGTFAADWPEQGNDVQASVLTDEFDALFFAAEVTPARLLSPPK